MDASNAEKEPVPREQTGHCDNLNLEVILNKISDNVAR